MAAVDELSQLKRLILGQEQQSIERLQERVELPATRAQDVAEVLSESFQLNADNAEELAESMRLPVQRCISDSVRDDPEQFADALFPVFGPAIRKAVRDSISALSEKINRAIERSFSAQGLKWRLESIRTGVPVAELILRDSFIYRVDEAFLIQRESGLLIAHVAREDVAAQDSDAVSAMLTAIQDFVSDSFSSSDGADLDTIRLGGEVVWLFHGPHAVTAAIIHGQPPREMRHVFEQVTENIHRLHGEQLENFAGTDSPDANSLRDISALLQPLLDSEGLKSTEATGEKKSKRHLYFVGGFILFVALGWMAYRIWERNKLDELLAAFDSAAGIELISVATDKPYSIRAFRDPLAPELSELVNGLRLRKDEIDVVFIPFQSLAPEIVTKRVSALFGDPTNVVFALQDSRLVVSGEVSPSLRTRLKGFPLSILGIESVDFAEVERTPAEIITELKRELDAPPSAVFELADKTAKISGKVPFDWFEKIARKQASTEGVESLDFSALHPEPKTLIDFIRSKSAAPEFVSFELAGRTLAVSGNHSERWRQQLIAHVNEISYVREIEFGSFIATEQEEIRALIEHINSQRFYFLRNDILTTESQQLAERLAADIQRLLSLERLFSDQSVEFLIRSSADASGTPQQHEAVRELRAEYIRQYLLDNGVNRDRITTVSGQTELADDNSLRWRRAEIQESIN